MKSTTVAIVLVCLSNGAFAFIYQRSGSASVSSSTRLDMSDYGTSVRNRMNIDFDTGRSSLVPIGSSPLARSRGTVPSLAEIWDSSWPVTVQGGWRINSYLVICQPMIDAVQVLLKSEGRPIDADVELWQGPDKTPHKMRVYMEDGAIRTFNAVIGTPRGPNTVSYAI